MAAPTHASPYLVYIIYPRWSASVSIGQHWSTLVNIGQHWSTLINIGQPLVNIGQHHHPRLHILHLKTIAVSLVVVCWLKFGT